MDLAGNNARFKEANNHCGLPLRILAENNHEGSGQVSWLVGGTDHPSLSAFPEFPIRWRLTESDAPTYSGGNRTGFSPVSLYFFTPKVEEQKLHGHSGVVNDDHNDLSTFSDSVTP